MEHNLIHRIVDTITGEVIERPYDENELAEVLEAQAEADAKKQALIEANIAKSALLGKLGITEEEAKLLLS